MQDRVVYKIVPRPLWAQAERTGVFTGSPVDHADGYIHFSNRSQVTATAKRHYRDVDDLLLVAVAVSSLGAGLRWEPSRGGELFPHLYGPLSLDAVISVRPLPLGPDGAHVFPSLEDPA